MTVEINEHLIEYANISLDLSVRQMDLAMKLTEGKKELEPIHEYIDMAKKFLNQGKERFQNGIPFLKYDSHLKFLIEEIDNKIDQEAPFEEVEQIAKNAILKLNEIGGDNPPNTGGNHQIRNTYRGIQI